MKAMNHLAKQQRNHLHERLLEEKKDLEKRIHHSDHYGLSNSLSEQTGEFSTYDNHPADIGSEEFERAKDIALNENDEHQLEEVNRAIENLQIGHYGVCLTCGKDIPFDRLDAVPYTSYCIQHSPNRSVSQRRPVEEQILTPPFGRTSLDELPEHTEFDGEDAWQIVEGWGTSNSPAMAEDPNVSDDYDSMMIEADENEGYVESLESFLATDIYGDQRFVVRNDKYRKYIEQEEGDMGLVPDEHNTRGGALAD